MYRCPECDAPAIHQCLCSNEGNDDRPQRDPPQLEDKLKESLKCIASGEDAEKYVTEYFW